MLSVSFTPIFFSLFCSVCAGNVGKWISLIPQLAAHLEITAIFVPKVLGQQEDIGITCSSTEDNILSTAVNVTKDLCTKPTIQPT